jgi:uncharacterized protein (TIGR03435 family)
MIAKILAAGFFFAGMAAAQTVGAPAKTYAFDVISIRQNKTPMPMEMHQFGPTGDGYRMTGQPLLLLLLTAYVPRTGTAVFYANDLIKGLPDWVGEQYDMQARIADEDRVEWQKPESQKAMLQAMLQRMLAERCKLVVHREVKETRVTSLVVAKGGVKFKETDPTVKHPDGQKLPWGGVMVPGGEDGMKFYDTSMASLASFLSSMANGGRPIQDKTGLAGRYDITLKLGTADADAESPLASMIASGLSGLGLKLDSEKGQVETLVIDHMERPSEN